MSANSLKARIKALSQHFADLNKQHIEIDSSSKIIKFIDDNRLYAPSKTGLSFHKSNEEVKLVMGAYGSGKSTMCVADIIFRACMMPRCKDGRRKCKVAVIRTTYAELETTTLAGWWEWCSKLGSSRKVSGRVLSCYHTFNDGFGLVDLELLFIALDRISDIDRFKSLQVSFAYINEASELPESALMHVRSRVGRYPSQEALDHQESWSGVIMDTNAPDTENWIYKTFEIAKPQSFRLFRQPPALIKTENGYVENPEADNILNLRKNYYQSLSDGASEDFIKVYCMGEYGLIRDGKQVFPQYNDDLHSTEHLEINPSETLYMGFDGGLTPACLICQIIGSQVRILKEFTTDRMGMIELSEIVEHWIRTNANGNTLYAVCDPACAKGDELNSELSAYNVLHDKFGCVPALTNDIQPRIEAVNFFLNRLSDGKPCLLLSRSGCPNLRKGFLNSYIYKRMRILNREEYRDVPNKTHPYSDIQDCLQYIALNYNGDCTKISKNNVDFRQLLNNSSSMWG